MKSTKTTKINGTAVSNEISNDFYQNEKVGSEITADEIEDAESTVGKPHKLNEKKESEWYSSSYF